MSAKIGFALMAMDLQRDGDGERPVWCEKFYKIAEAAHHQAAVNNERDRTIMYWVEDTEFEGWDG